MGDVTRLHGSPHEQTLRLLPWYNNGTLPRDEAALVELHLAECAECRSEAEFDRMLGDNVASMRLDVEHGWASLGRSLGSAHPTSASPAAKTGQIVSPPFWRRRVPVAWMVGGQAAAALLVFAVFATPLSTPEPQTYHALGSKSAGTAGNMVVVFDPATTEANLRAALVKVGAQVVDGPNASGAYVLRVAEPGKAKSLDQLRSMREVVLAEPIGGGEAS
jgi:hypothetical protein